MRHNWRLRIGDLYPQRQDNTCRCGCLRTPAGRRRSWATSQCYTKAVQDLKIRMGHGNTIRRAVFKRDGGICADCGRDTEAERELCLAWRPPPEADPALWERHVMSVRLEMQRLGFPSPINTWWQADHIIPVEFGGGGCGLEGFATRCIACHRRKTAEQAAESAARRRLCRNGKAGMVRR